MDGWKVLCQGATEKVVLAIDFGVTGRPEAGFADLVSQLDGDFTVWESRPPPGGGVEALSGEDYVAHWLAGVHPAEESTVAVFGFCVGAVFAGRLAEAFVSETGRRPEIVLFDPETPDPKTLFRDFRGAVDRLSALLPDEKLTAAQAEGEEIYGRLRDYSPLCFELAELFGRTTKMAFDLAGLDPEIGAEVAGTFTSYVSYLRAANELGRPRSWSDAIAMSSFPLDEGSGIGRRMEFETDHGEILRTHAVAQAVRRILT
ncbi:hypothetical protein J2Z21_009694 [Streptomyces griseochromogenes]|uniref:Thioesterase domain-containing protein n=1 Tax=Streptomyces griseochromogenes TaxID=68214 RepID=A0ABS4MAI3_9ACTN|nr:hypothetical protein [Streptomyces griseochromogenes]MBP2056675.1 hypothetical protein [Streptomyces griseochromogenes]